MKYLIKDLSKLSGVAPARIRKWQERYDLFHPTVGENGYKYYSNDDLFTLKYIKSQLDNGVLLKIILRNLAKIDIREAFAQQHSFDEQQLRLIQWVTEKNFIQITEYCDKALQKHSFAAFIDKTLQPLVVTVGQAWEQQLISVADEHAFSHWMMHFVAAKIQDKKIALEKKHEKFKTLVCVFPGDLHELGALMLYAKMIDKEIPCRFCGMLPEDELIKEIYSNAYEAVYISLAVDIKLSELQNFEKRLLSRFKNLKIHFGGYGYEKMKKKLTDE